MPSKEFPWGVTYIFDGTPGSKDFRTTEQRQNFIDKNKFGRDAGKYKNVKKLPKFK